MKYLLFASVCLQYTGLVICSNTTTTQSPIVTTKSNATILTTTQPPPITATPEPPFSCNTSSTCSSCTKDRRCYWCSSTKQCEKYIVKDVVPRDCPSKHWYWKQCTISGQILIIVIPSVVGFLLLLCGCLIYCKCCRKKTNYGKEDDRVQRRKEERRQKESQRKTERKERTDEIRRKYGLLKDEDEEPLI